MQKQCKNCNISFNITNQDLEFYKKVSPIFDGKKSIILEPALCPNCRQQRRLSFLNQTRLYKNTCKKCNKETVSRISSDKKLINYCNECWSGDDWDKFEKGSDIDFNKSIFSQIDYLLKNTPFQNLIGSLSNIENNSVYTNHTSEIHNSYFVTEANTISDSYYCSYIKNSSNLVDSSFVGNSQYVYSSVDCYDMYNCFYSKESFGCKNSYFLDNCKNCDFCVCSTNLINKKYYIFNKQATKSEYEGIVKKLSNYSYFKEVENQFKELSKNRLCKSSNMVSSERSSGNNIISSNNCNESFDILGCEDCKYCTSVNYSTDLFDVSSYGEKSSLMYESVSVGRFSTNILFSSIIGKGEKLIYCIDVKKSTNCFACVNLKDANYCILNKQYTKEEYNTIVPKIIEHMKTTGEWGEFFPSSISPFGYNETVADEYFPLSKEEILEQGFNYSDYKSPFPKVNKIISASKMPDNISVIPDDILNWAIECEVSKKPFKIIKQELEFYRKHNLPIPRKHPDIRHEERKKLRNPRKLFNRKCDKCNVDMKTTYSPDREGIVYCEECYEKEVY